MFRKATLVIKRKSQALAKSVRPERVDDAPVTYPDHQHHRVERAHSSTKVVSTVPQTLQETSETSVIAKSLPPELLRVIFGFIPPNDYKATLKSCTLVCRLWCLESSPLLLKTAKLECAYSCTMVSASKPRSFLRLRIKSKRKENRPPSKLHLCFAEALLSSRISATVQHLEVNNRCGSNDCLEFEALHAVVTHMHKLQSLRLGPLRFQTFKHNAQAFSLPKKRLQIHKLMLCWHPFENLPPDQPAVLDALLWFDVITHLELSGITSSHNGFNIAHKLCTEASPPKTLVHSLVLDGCAFQAYTSKLEPVGAICLDSLTSLEVSRLSTLDIGIFNTFLKQHGSCLERCSLSLSSDVPGADNVHPVHAVAVGSLDLTYCTKLQSFTFLISVSPRVDDVDGLSLLWNRSLEAIVASASITELKLEAKLEHMCPPVSGDPYLPFLTSLRWNPLNRSLGSGASPIRSLKVAVWSQETPVQCFGESSLVATEPRYMELVRAELSHGVQDILSFETGSLPLYNSLPSSHGW